MKKSIIVLLIAVLVAGFAFAGTLTGSAGLKFDVDLQNKTWGFANPQSWKYSFSFEYDTTKVEVKGEGDLYAELAITGSAKASISNKTDASGNVSNTYSVKLSKANIHWVLGEGKDLVIGLLGPGAGVNYVSSYYKAGSSAIDVVKAQDAVYKGGFTVDFMGWNGGLGANGSWTDDDFFYNVFAHAQTKKFEFAEKKVGVQAGAYVAYSNVAANEAKNIVGGSVKADAKVLEDKVSVSAAADLAYAIKAEEFKMEASAKAGYEFQKGESITLDVYANNAEDDFKLDAKLSYAKHVFDFNEKASLELSGYVEIRDSLIDSRELTVSATEAVNLLEAKALKLTFTETYKVLVAKTLEIVASAEYTAPENKFVATAKISPSFQFADSDADLLTKLAFECGIKSAAIIDKAEIGLTYKGADFIKAGDSIKNKGVVSAYATIAFPAK